ncbi:replication initiator protein A [Acidipila sp. EB88]|nr:replication initiator protein A [Acidipila sp. EB88]
MAPRKSFLEPTLITQPDAVDLIRFEKNLLQIGFFGAHERRGKQLSSSRRIEQWVNRAGKKIKVSAEFRSSELLGLPSTSDRDKYMGFMKLLMDMKLKSGLIQNPIRFSGYTLLKVLGQCDSGENYEAINSWGQRMADTTITSEQVIYSSARKRYMNKTVHVFRSFTRVGSSNLDGTDKVETYEVELEDWLLENLNESFVVPEDFNMYRKLLRPTAKGIFVYLYLWFFASKGKEVEKDYSELCALLNVRAYDHVSKIRETMGLSLEDLVGIGYLKSWDIKPMSSKAGYKLILTPGASMKEVLALTQRRQLALGVTPADESLSGPREVAKAALVEQGVSMPKATELAKKYEPGSLLDYIDYVTCQVEADRSNKIKNPPGYLITFIEGEQKVPPSFRTKRQRQIDDETDRDIEALRAAEQAREFAEFELKDAYRKWCLSQAEEFIAKDLEGELLSKRLRNLSSQLRKNPTEAARLDRLPSALRSKELMSVLKKEIVKELALLPFEDWVKANTQGLLF